jgi:hypothetical protein
VCNILARHEGTCEVVDLAGFAAVRPEGECIEAPGLPVPNCLPSETNAVLNRYSSVHAKMTLEHLKLLPTTA